MKIMLLTLVPAIALIGLAVLAMGVKALFIKGGFPRDMPMISLRFVAGA